MLQVTPLEKQMTTIQPLAQQVVLLALRFLKKQNSYTIQHQYIKNSVCVCVGGCARNLDE